MLISVLAYDLVEAGSGRLAAAQKPPIKFLENLKSLGKKTLVFTGQFLVEHGTDFSTISFSSVLVLLRVIGFAGMFGL